MGYPIPRVSVYASACISAKSCCIFWCLVELKWVGLAIETNCNVGRNLVGFSFIMIIFCSFALSIHFVEKWSVLGYYVMLVSFCFVYVILWVLVVLSPSLCSFSSSIMKSWEVEHLRLCMAPRPIFCYFSCTLIMLRCSWSLLVFNTLMVNIHMFYV